MASKKVETKPVSSRRISVAWPTFAVTLAKVLGKFQEGQFLILQGKKSPHYIQFAAQGAYGFRVETTSNAFLAKNQQFTAEQISYLLKAGWQAPTEQPDKSTPEDDPDGSPNFFIDFPASACSKALAQLAVHLFTEILHVPHPGNLEYGAFDDDDNEVLLPELGLRHLKAAAAEPLPLLLLKAVAEISGNPDLSYDEDGDIGLRYDSIVTFIRPIGETACVQFFSRLIEEAKKTPALLARLNEINANSSRLHLAFVDGAVFAMADIPATPLVGTHLKSTLDHFCVTADGLSRSLTSEFGRKGLAAANTQTMVLH